MKTQIVGSGAVSPSSPMLQPQVLDGAQSPPSQEGSVAVVLRVRPLSPRERAAPRVLHILDQRVVLLSPEEPGSAGGTARSPGRRRRSFKLVFDHVFDEGATQEEVFQHTTLPLLDTLLAGYNCSVFAYGASGVGKTHTMMGSKTSRGIVHLATVELYKRLEAMKDTSWEVLISYQQVYKERVYDLLEPQGPLNIWEQPGKGAVAQGLSFHQPKSPEKLLDMLAKGNKNRAQRHTKANATSSCSHAIFQIQVKLWDPAGGLARDLRVAKLSFIDLAGSERVLDTAGQGEGLWEGTSINRSLLALKSVVWALAGAKGRQSHVPFRDSKLTRLLKDSLGGSCRSTVIAAVSPAAPAGPDTLSTLRFASRARHILLPDLQLQRTGMSPCSPRAASLPYLPFQARTPPSLPQELSGHQEQRITAKTEEVEVLVLEESTGPEETTGPENTTGPEETTRPEDSTELEESLGPEESIRPENITGPQDSIGQEDSTELQESTGPEEAAAPNSPTEPSEATPAPGMQLSCAAEAPVTVPDPPVPSADPECSRELSPCSSPRPMSPGPVKRMLESSSDSESENSCCSRTRRKRQRRHRKAAETPRAAQSPVQSPSVSPGPRRVSPQPSSPAGTPSPGTLAPAAARTPSPLPGPAPELIPPRAEQQPELRAALPHPLPSAHPCLQTPNASSFSLSRSSCSPPSISPFPAVPPCPWFQLYPRVCTPPVGSVLFVCLQVMGGFRK